jgi:hypothetical protein
MRSRVKMRLFETWGRVQRLGGIVVASLAEDGLAFKFGNLLNRSGHNRSSWTHKQPQLLQEDGIPDCSSPRTQRVERPLSSSGLL